MFKKGTYVSLLLIFVVALVVRGLYINEMEPTPVFEIPMIDEEAYDEQAMHMVETGDWMGDKIYYQDPLYPYFLAVIYEVYGHDPFAPRVVQAMIGALTCLLIFLLGSELFDRRVGFLAGIMAALYKPFIFQETLLLKTSLVLFAITLALWLLLVAARKGSISLCLLAGAFLGLGILVRGNYMLFAPLAVLWVLVAMWRHSAVKAVASVIVFVVGMAALISPVTIRNYVVGDDFVLTTSQAGTNFYTAHHLDNKTGTLEPPPFIHTTPAYEDRDFKQEAERQTGQKDMKPSEVSSFWFQQGLAAIAADPGLFLHRLWLKLRYASTDFEPPDNQSLYFTQKYFSEILRLNPLTFGVIFPFALVGLVLALFKPWRRSWLLHIFWLTYLVSLLIFYVFARSRLPLVPVLIVFAAFALKQFVLEIRETRKAHWAFAAPLFVVASIWVWWPVAPVDHTILWNNLGASYTMRNQLDDAEEAYRHVVDISNRNREEADQETLSREASTKLNRDLAMGYLGIGRVARSRGDLQVAEEYFRKTIPLDTEGWQAHGELGNILLKTQRIPEAEEQFKKAIERYPHEPILHLQLGRAYLMQSKNDKSEAALREGLKLAPESPDLHFMLGWLLNRIGKKEDAREHFQKALEIAPEGPWAEDIKRSLEALSK